MDVALTGIFLDNGSNKNVPKIQWVNKGSWQMH